MIKIVNKDYRPTAEELVGKWVLKDGMYVWPTLSTPRIVSSASGKRIYVEQQRPVRDLVNRPYPSHFEETGEREPDGHWMVGTVACVCDTAAEVNAVMAESARLHAEFDAYKKQADARLKALDGTTA
jgi:hypothetical protein